MAEDPVFPEAETTRSEPVSKPLPSDPAALVQYLEERRTRLAATVDELARRATPGAMARRSKDQLRARLRATTHTPDGGMRWERIVAVSSAATISVASLGWLVRRRFR